MRNERNFIDDTTIETLGKAKAAESWSQVSKNCPNYAGG